MTDKEKLEAVKAEIRKLKGNPYFMMAIRDVLGIIDSLQEETVVQCVPFEPVGIPVDKVVSANIPDKKEETVSDDSVIMYGMSASVGLEEAVKNRDEYKEWQGSPDIQKELIDFAKFGNQYKEPVSNDLEKFATYYADGHYMDFAEQGDEDYWKTYYACIASAKWQKNHLWKPADGDDLPEYEREVVVFTQNYPDDAEIMSVAIGHRPNPDGWDGKSITTGKIEHYTPKTYDRGGWNIPNVVYWLDAKLP